jgi:hypothetical protein
MTGMAVVLDGRPFLFQIAFIDQRRLIKRPASSPTTKSPTAAVVAGWSRAVRSITLPLRLIAGSAS